MSDWLTSEELAQETRTSLDTVRYWRSKDLGPLGVRIGKRVLYRRSDVDEWLASREAEERNAREQRRVSVRTLN